MGAKNSHQLFLPYSLFTPRGEECDAAMGRNFHKLAHFLPPKKIELLSGLL